jgi:hypothetical protein
MAKSNSKQYRNSQPNSCKCGKGKGKGKGKDKGKDKGKVKGKGKGKVKGKVKGNIIPVNSMKSNGG